MELHLTTSDGCPLSAQLYAADEPHGAVLIVAAMGVAQRFYAPFARWLAGQGFTTLTFDFRGIGSSQTGPLSKTAADIDTWAQRDTACAVDALTTRTPGLPLTWIGHSLGGQIVPLVPNADRAHKIITVATGSGYWRQNAPALRKRVWLLWWAAVPLTTPLFGYFPGRRLGMVGDLPRGVIEQWRKWCLDPEYAVGAEGPEVRARFAAVKTPLVSLSFTDDEMMSEVGIASIHSFYSGAPKTMRRFSPADLGVDKVGHFGFFRAGMERLWMGQVRGELATA